jgi:hypothetical protein
MNILKKLLKAYKNLQIHWYIWYLKYSENGCTMIKCIKKCALSCGWSYFSGSHHPSLVKTAQLRIDEFPLVFSWSNAPWRKFQGLMSGGYAAL